MRYFGNLTTKHFFVLVTMQRPFNDQLTSIQNTNAVSLSESLYFRSKLIVYDTQLMLLVKAELFLLQTCCRVAFS